METRWRNPHDHRRYDHLGRRQPRRLSIATLLGTARYTASERLRKVPAAAIVGAGDDDSGDFSLVSCSCGHRPVVRIDLNKCPGCERWFMVTGGQVWVVYGDMEPPSA